MAFARANGIVLHHEDRGRKDRPAIVYSNSLGSDFRIWNEVVDLLGDGWRHIRYDKRGHGLSEATPAPYRLDDHIDDLAALLDHLDVRKAAIVGVSVGGMIAQGLASKRPDLVSALVLCDTAHKIGTDELWNDRIRTTTEKGIASMADAIMQRWFPPSYRTHDNPAVVGYEAMLTRTTVDGYAGTSAALRDADLTEQTKALKLPTLCLVGDQDGATPPDLVRSLADLIDGAEYHVIENAGHLPCIDQPGEVAGLIGRFLSANHPAQDSTA
ncbi:MAG: 3-oxoadipate enol-lactonase [Rhizobiaceae bacterium]|nr:3-oxoadipate enol-lactonase [Rhizobiaceae bacterium]MCV0407886.1 3-oxoadipate enol-lactonase [Rhizobiaceae bacterium]